MRWVTATLTVLASIAMWAGDAPSNGQWHSIFKDQYLAEITDVAARDGVVAVLTYSFPAVHLWFEDRGMSRSWGVEGAGPGDLENQAHIALEKNRVIVVTHPSARAKVFSLEGELLETLSLTPHQFVRQLEVHRSGWWVEAFSGKDPPVKPVVGMREPDERLFSIEEGPAVTLRAKLSLTVPEPFMPTQVWCAHANGLAFWDAKEPELIWLDEKGTRIGSYPLPDTRFRVQPEDFDIWLDQELPSDVTKFGIPDFFGSLREEARKLELPPYFPLVLELVPDEKDGVWVLRDDGHDGQQWLWARPLQEPVALAFPGGKRAKAFGTSFIVFESVDAEEQLILLSRKDLELTTLD